MICNWVCVSVRLFLVSPCVANLHAACIKSESMKINDSILPPVQTNVGSAVLAMQTALFTPALLG